MGCTLTFDLGTTFFKAGIFDASGNMLALVRTAVPTAPSNPGRKEIAVETFRRTIAKLTDELHRQAPSAFAGIKGICFATQTNSFVLLDAHDQPLTPIILWNDRRAEPISPTVGRLAEHPDFYQTTGVPALGSGFMAAKLQWLGEHDPKLFSQARRLCLIGDYLIFWLTGEHVTEAGAAALTGLIDIHQLQWRAEPIDALGLTGVKLPRIERAGTPVRTLRSRVAAQLGLPQDCQMVLGCLDQYAGAIGAGNIVPGQVSETTGTVLATVSLAERFDPSLAAAGVFQGPAFRPGWYYRMAFGNVSANLLEAYRQHHASDLSYEQLTAAAAQVAGQSNPVKLDAAASAAKGTPVFIGHARYHSHGQNVLAILQAIAEALVQQVKRVSPEQMPTELRCVGGGAQSDLLLQLKAAALHTTTVALYCAEPTSLGAALLARGTDHLPPLQPPASPAVRSRFFPRTSQVPGEGSA